MQLVLRLCLGLNLSMAHTGWLEKESRQNLWTLVGTQETGSQGWQRCSTMQGKKESSFLTSIIVRSADILSIANGTERKNRDGKSDSD